jgi:hypothetical protein
MQQLRGNYHFNAKLASLTDPQRAAVQSGRRRDIWYCSIEKSTYQKFLIFHCLFGEGGT